MSSNQGSYETGRGHPIARCSGVLLDALDGVASSPGWSMSTPELAPVLVDLTRAQARLSELRLRVLAAADTSDIGAATGTCSTVAWLAHETLQTRPKAAADVRLAQHLDTAFEATRAALGDGRVNEEQARVIVTAISDLPDTVSPVDRCRAEVHLIEQAGSHDAKDLRVMGRRLFEVIDPDKADEEEGKRERGSRRKRPAHRPAFPLRRERREHRDHPGPPDPADRPRRRHPRHRGQNLRGRGPPAGG